jgi:hypothetical protein
MRISNAIRVGLAFGVAFVIGGIAAAAVTSSTSSPTAEPEPVFSTARLEVFGDTSALVDAEQLGLDPSVLEFLDGSSLYESVQSEGVAVYIAELADGSLCVLAVSTGDGTVMTCGAMEAVAAGQVAFRSQNRPQDPSLFVGIASNDVNSIKVGDRVGVVSDNAFLATGGPSDDVYTLGGESGLEISVDMNIDQTYAEESGSNSSGE